jgi:hypothetical protein
MIKWKRTAAPADHGVAARAYYGRVQPFDVVWSECDALRCPEQPEYVLWNDLQGRHRPPKPTILCAWHADKMIPRNDPASA